jgi:agmatine deiminase
MTLTQSLIPWDGHTRRLPAAWELHGATVMAYPSGDDLWFGRLKEVRREHDQLILAIAQGEDVLLFVQPHEVDALQAAPWQNHPRVRAVPFAYDDIWLRDSGPVVVATSAAGLGAAQTSWLAYDFLFNAWGDKFFWEHDDLIARRVCDLLDLPRQRVPFVFEGGAIDSNGAGAALTTRQCLLEPHRNPSWTEAQIHDALLGLFGLNELIWLESGISGDHTDGHIDTIARFVSADTVVCHYAESEAHPSYAALRSNLEQLRTLAAQGGSAIRHVVPLPLPRAVEQFEGDYKTLTYANFYCCNAGLLVPQFGDANDSLVLEILKGVVTERKVLGLDARHLVLGGGVFNCLTQPIPGPR